MFASRLPEQIQPSPLAELTARIRASGAPLLDLTESNPTRAGIRYPEREILAGFQDPRLLLYDPDSLGLPAARERIAELQGVSPEQVMLTASTSEAYAWLFKLLCDPGDEILVPQPSYPLFELLARLESVVVRQYPLRHYRGWFVDTHALSQQITPRTRAVVVVHPNNPTGSYLKRHELSEISGICARRNIALISDEVFADYALADDAERAPSATTLHLTCPAFTLSGLSKVVGMPQVKLGWIIASGHPHFRKLLWRRLEIIADTYLSVGTPVQCALPAILSARDAIQTQIISRLKDNLSWLREQLKGATVSLLPVEGGWSAILQVPQTRSEDEWVTTLLRDHGVLVHPGYFYDFDSEAFLVVSLLTPIAAFREGIGRLLRLAG